MTGLTSSAFIHMILTSVAVTSNPAYGSSKQDSLTASPNMTSAVEIDVSTLPLVSQNTLARICLYVYLLLKQEVVIQKRCFSKSPSVALHFVNLKFMSTSASHMML